MNRSVEVVVFGLLSAAMVPSLATAASDGLLADIPAPTGGNALGTEFDLVGWSESKLLDIRERRRRARQWGAAGTIFVRICVWPEEPADDNCG